MLTQLEAHHLVAAMLDLGDLSAHRIAVASDVADYWEDLNHVLCVHTCIYSNAVSYAAGVAHVVGYINVMQ